MPATSGGPPSSGHDSAYRQPHLPAAQVDVHLRGALADFERAEQSAVFWFSEVMRRKLYRDLGYSSIHQYAHEALGFSKARTSQFLRLCEELRRLPKLKRSVESGEVPWTKARTVARVATPSTEQQWIQQATQCSRRELEQRVERVRSGARVLRRRNPQQGSLEIAPSQPSRGAAASADAVAPGGGAVSGRAVAPEGAAAAANRAASRADRPAPSAVRATLGADRACAGADRAAVDGVAALCDEATLAQSAADERPVRLQLDLTPEQYARFEALVERHRKNGVRQSREELILEALDRALESTSPQVIATVEDRTTQAASEFTRVNSTDLDDSQSSRNTEHRACSSPAPTVVVRSSPYQVIVYLCEDCGRAHAPTTRGDQPVTGAALGAILSDAMLLRSGQRNTATVPPRLRRAALARDGNRCRAAGCDRARFLNVHHLNPRDANGPNELDNLITLCRGCHEAAHERARRMFTQILGRELLRGRL
jgi:hypothetical protein